MLSVVIPAQDEQQSIASTLDELRIVLGNNGQPYEIIVVDDGSVDNTAEIVRQEEKALLIQHLYNKGYGAALKTGISKASGDIILIIDADGTYQADDIPKLLEYMEDYDMIVGSRNHKGVKIPLCRKPAKWFLTKLASYLSDTNIPDLNSGMRVFRKSDIVKFSNILSSGFSFTTTSTLAYLCNDLAIKYVPIEYHKRKGKSKIKPLRDGFNFILLILRVITYFNPLKVFLPVAFILATVAVAVFILSLLLLDRIMDATVAILFVAAIQIGVLGLLADVIAKKRGE